MSENEAKTGVLGDLANLQQQEEREPDSFDGLGALVPVDVAIVKAENEQLASMARMNPRNESAVSTAILNEIERAPALVKKSALYYRIPSRGEGLTINAAQIIARRWGNNMSTVQVSAETEAGTTCTGVFIDLETNVRTSIPKMVSRYERRKKYRNGKPVYAPDPITGKEVQQYVLRKLEADEFAIAVDRAASKAYRNAVLRSVPTYIKEAVIEKIKEIEGKDFREGSKEANIDRMVTGFNKLGVTADTLEEYLDHPLKGITEEEFVDLTGVFSAIKNGEISAKSAFGIEETPTKAAMPADGSHSTRKGKKLDPEKEVKQETKEEPEPAKAKPKKRGKTASVKEEPKEEPPTEPPAESQAEEEQDKLADLVYDKLAANPKETVDGIVKLLEKDNVVTTKGKVLEALSMMMRAGEVSEVEGEYEVKE